MFVTLTMTFLGSVSVSAQNYYSNSQAAAVIGTELNALAQGPSQNKSAGGSSTLLNQPVTPSQSVEFNAIKVVVLGQIMQQLKEGVSTGTAIDNVFNAIPATGTRAILLADVKAHIIDLLS